MANTSRRIGRWIVGVLVIALAVGVGWWAAKATLTDTVPTQEAPTERVLATVTDASVGRTYNFNVTVKQPLTLVAANSLAGVVTYVSPGGVVSAGDILYSVANIPVRVVAGSVPFYRPLSQNARGEDVAQFQAMLAALGYDLTADGVWGAGTTRIVKQWQKDTGRPQTGVIGLGELVAVQQLPTTVTIGKDIKLGHILAGGEDAVLARFGDPEFVLSLSNEQSQLVPMDATVEVTFEDLQWQAVIAETRTATSEWGPSGIEYVLTAADGGLVCGSECARLPADEQIQLRSRVQVVPQVSGPGVPAAAVRTDATGATYVLMADGTRRPVTVLASGEGIAVLDGVTAGEQVQMPAGAGSPTPASAPGTTPSEGDGTSSDSTDASSDGTETTPDSTQG